ncbi:hypothetical protein HAX54_053318, partial [Datura stramonium]|nr:hypothetical protein [Datura stramonium]
PLPNTRGSSVLVDHDRQNVGTTLMGYMFSIDNCPDLRLDCVTRVATCGSQLESSLYKCILLMIHL